MNRLLAINFNNNDCLIHLHLNHEKMDVYILDQMLQEELQTKKFSINNSGAIRSDVDLQEKIDTGALFELYEYLLHQHQGAVLIAA